MEQSTGYMTMLLQQLITEQAKERPEATAVVLGEEKMTYGQVEALSNRLARMLKSHGCRPGDRICFLMSKSPVAVVSLLGILKADCIYVPLAPESPARRLLKIVESCRPRWLLAAGSTVNLLSEIFRVADHEIMPVGWMDTGSIEDASFKPEFCLTDLYGCSPQSLDYQNSSADVAYIMFTSGSTGLPKGVTITHENVLRFVEWANDYFAVTPDDRHSGHAPLHFDLSTLDIFGTLAAGAKLYLVPSQLNLLASNLADFVRCNELTQWFSVPSVLKYMAKLDVVAWNDFPTLKRVVWCGEVLPTPTLIYWMERLPHVTFTNLYGPTEATVASSYYTVPECPSDPTTSIPIGTPCRGEELLVLDEELHPVPPDEIGDLYIRGVGLSPGYWEDPEKTAAAYLPDPASSNPDDRLYKTGDLASVGNDGLIYFHGRADYQIKSRGYRIELGEIEAALNTIDFLVEGAIVAIETDRFEGNLICCAYVSSMPMDDAPITIRQELSELLPAYMLPARWLSLSELPKTTNGKIDRRTLQEHFQRVEATAQLTEP